MKTVPLHRLLSNGAIWFGKFAGGASQCVSHKMSASTGLSAVDEALQEGGLLFGAIHEWSLASLAERQKNSWHPPLLIISEIIKNAILQKHHSPTSLMGEQIFWIGRRCWPAPIILENALPEELPKKEQLQWKDRSFFLDPPDHKRRLWTLLETLRSPSVGIVIGDGSKLDALSLRRLQLAAQRGNTLGLIMRPPWEIEHSSVAQTRWRLTSVLSPTKYPRWNLELIKARGLASSKQWTIEWSDKVPPDHETTETYSFHLLPHPLHGSDQAPKQRGGQEGWPGDQQEKQIA